MTEVILAYDRSPTDLTTYQQDEALVLQMLGEVRAVKFGKEAASARLWKNKVPTTAALLMSAAISQYVGGVLFWDDKMIDVENTMVRAVHNLAGKITGLTVSLSASTSGLKAVVKARDAAAGKNFTRHIALWGNGLLTDMGMVDVASINGTTDADAKFMFFVKRALDLGFDGITCSGHQLRLMREAGVSEDLGTFVLGVRPDGWNNRDEHQKWITPREARALNATYIGVGRPVWEGPLDPVTNLRVLKESMCRRA